MPTDPPFTAFVGNLNRSMEMKEFRGEMERMLADRGVSCVFDVFLCSPWICLCECLIV